MKLGIVGLPNVGKSTLFNSLTKAGAESANYPFCTIDPNVGVVAVPDERLGLLADMYHSAKVTPAVIEFVDIAGLVKGASKGEGLGNQFLANIREVDAIVHVVRCFEDPNVIHVDGSIDPLRDIETINLELIFSDLEILERRISKTVRGARNDKALAKELFDRYFESMVVEMSDLTTTYCAFIGVETPEISQEAREYVTKCADVIIEGKIVSIAETENRFTDCDEHTKVWWPVFMGLSRYVYTDARYAVRNDCCERIFAIFQNSAVHFSEKLWELVFNGFIFTIFDGPMKSGEEAINQLLALPTEQDKPIKLGNKAENQKSYLQTTGALVMYSIIRLYVKRRDQVSFLLERIFNLMQDAMKQQILSLARIGVFCLKQLFLEGADMYDETMWNTMLDQLAKAFANTMPDDLVLNARKKLYLIYDKNLRAGGVAPKVGRWVRTPVGNGKLIAVDDICATVELIHGNAYFHKLSELEDLEKLKKEAKKTVKVKKSKSKSKKHGSDSESSSSSDSESSVEEQVVEDPIKLETTDTRSLEVNAMLVATKAVTQADLSALISELVDIDYRRFTFDQLKRMLGLMQKVADMTRDFHQDMELRRMIKKLGSVFSVWSHG